ncbi:MAG: tetratricopeptide repeat protein [Bacteroidia bacterium]|nr:tetratricopeptide repeat protein [Bacteroidia bacterium]
MSEQELFEHFDRFLKNQLDETEVDSFNLKLREDAEFKKGFEDYKNAVNVLELNSENVIDQELERLNELYPVENSKVKSLRSNNSIYLLIAACLLIVLLSGAYYNASTNYSTDQIVSTELSSYGAFNNRSAGSNESADPGIELYRKRDYLKVVEHYSNVDPDQLDNTQTFYLANSHLLSGNSENAIRYFEKVVESDDIRFKEVSEWYLGLSYLKSGNDSKACKLFKTISTDPQHSYRNKASRILQKLDSPWRKIPGIN